MNHDNDFDSDDQDPRFGEGSSANQPFDFDEMQQVLRQLLAGSGANPFNPNSAQHLTGQADNSEMLQNIMRTIKDAVHNPQDEINWETARHTALKAAGGEGKLDTAAADSAFSVAGLWLDEATTLGAVADAPRVISRVEWVQHSIDTWTSLAEPVALSVSQALAQAMREQLPEEIAGTNPGPAEMLRGIGQSLFAVQLGSIVGQLSAEVVSAGDIGIPLFADSGYLGGALLPSGVKKFAAGLEQPETAVLLYLAVRELAHARLFRHTKWLRLHLLTAIGDYARGIHVDIAHLNDLADEFDPEQPEQLQELLRSGALIPEKSPAQAAAHERLETMLALIEGWADVVTAAATTRLPGAEAIAEMVRRRRATGGPAERAFSALAGLELRPRRLREAAQLWRTVLERSDKATRDNLWAHPDILPTADEIDAPDLLLRRLGLLGDVPADDIDAALQEILDTDS